jgi:hypothetical protein
MEGRASSCADLLESWLTMRTCVAGIVPKTDCGASFGATQKAVICRLLRRNGFGRLYESLRVRQLYVSGGIKKQQKPHPVKVWGFLFVSGCISLRLDSAAIGGATSGAIPAKRESCPTMPLTELAIKAARPDEKIARLYDEKGLYLEISPAGGKWWRFKYWLCAI